MLFKFYLIFVIINSIQCQSAFEEEANLKICNFFDTINITDGIRNPDESITFNEIRFAKEDYETFTYTYLANQVKILVPAHIRGCICKYKNCVRKCCPTGYSSNITISNNQWQHKCIPNNIVMELDLNDNNNIVFVTEMPCKVGYKWVPPNKNFDGWRVLPNGSLILEKYLHPFIVNRNAYCLADVFDNDTGSITSNVMVCDILSDVKTPPNIFQLIYPAVMIVTVIFLSLTLFVYSWIEELRTQHGKIFMCYLATWIIGYSALAFGRIADWRAYNKPTSCLILAEVKHTAFIAGFIWLSIIGYDIWRAVGRANQRDNQFFKYCCFAAGSTIVIVLLTNMLDHVNLLDKHLRPGFGTAGCWLQVKGYILYLYSFVIIIMMINTVFFILTKRKIEQVQIISHAATNVEGSKKFSRDETDADRIHLFIRLAIIMGLPWLLQIVSWLLTLFTIYGFIVFRITDIVIKLIGPVIFFLCIKKPRVKRLMQKKWSTIRSTGVWKYLPSYSHSNTTSTVT